MVPGPNAYTVEARWIDALWHAHKLTHERYGQCVARCRQGVIPRKRNLDAVVEAEAAEAADKDMLARIDRIRNNPDIYSPFADHPQAAEWLKLHPSARRASLCATTVANTPGSEDASAAAAMLPRGSQTAGRPSASAAEAMPRAGHATAAQSPRLRRKQSGAGVTP